MLHTFSRPLLRVIPAVIVLASIATATSVASAHTAQPDAPDDASAGPANMTAIECPVDGQSDFVDSWDDPRSGGRRHQGVDMAAPQGTPVVAVTAGFAEFKSSNLGGNAIWLTTATGDTFYYAHLDAWEGKSREVNAGDVVGYVGSSGNAGGNHLHFESHPDGVPSNPFPAVAAGCAEPSSAESDAPDAADTLQVRLWLWLA